MVGFSNILSGESSYFNRSIRELNFCVYEVINFNDSGYILAVCSMSSICNVTYCLRLLLGTGYLGVLSS